jgi:FtsP/CotA-like multicopper oxidase with cupredoxin domain
MGTSDPDAEWIGLEPAPSERQCYCYKFEIAQTQSTGQFLYHTHRHGTSTMLTWSGMFGYVVVGDATLEEATETAGTDTAGSVLEPGSAPTLLGDLSMIAEQAGLHFDERDIFPFVVYDSVWRYAAVPWDESQTTMPPMPAPDSPDSREVILSDWWAGVRYQTYLHPWLVNGVFHPTLSARTGALTLFRLACISASKVCAFQILRHLGEAEFQPATPEFRMRRMQAKPSKPSVLQDSVFETQGLPAGPTIVPFYQVASDGISYSSPRYRAGNGDPASPDISASEAYVAIGGGMREDIVVQFPAAGTYTIEQVSNAFDDGYNQRLATVHVSEGGPFVSDVIPPEGTRRRLLFGSMPDNPPDDEPANLSSCTAPSEPRHSPPLAEPRHLQVHALVREGGDRLGRRAPHHAQARPRVYHDLQRRNDSVC